MRDVDGIVIIFEKWQPPAAHRAVPFVATANTQSPASPQHQPQGGPTSPPPCCDDVLGTAMNISPTPPPLLSVSQNVTATIGSPPLIGIGSPPPPMPADITTTVVSSSHITPPGGTNATVTTAGGNTPPAHNHQLELPTCEDYFRDLLYRVEVLFIDKVLPNDVGFTLELSQRMSYDQMAAAVGQKIGCDPYQIQFFKCQK